MEDLIGAGTLDLAAVLEDSPFTAPLPLPLEASEKKITLAPKNVEKEKQT